MRDDIAARIHACYPQGIWDLFDEAQADYSAAQAFLARLPGILERYGFVTSGPHVWSQHERVVEIPLRRQGEPDEWYFNTDRDRKIVWLRETGLPIVSLEVSISTVVPAIHFDIAETRFNPDTWGEHATGQYDDGLKTLHRLDNTKHEPWATLIVDLRALAVELAIEELDRATLDENIPVLSSPIFSDDETDDDDQLGDWTSEANVRYIKSLPQQVARLYDALFGKYL